MLATFQIIVFGWVWGMEKGMSELERGASIKVPAIFRPIIKWVCPAFLLSIFALWLLKEIFGFDLSTAQFGAVSGYVTDLFGSSAKLPAQLSVALAVAIFIFFALISSRSKSYRRAEQGLPKSDA